MVGYPKYENGYKLLYPSSQKTFIEMSVQFEEELMQETGLSHGECSHPPLRDDVSDESFSNFFDYDIFNDDDDMHSYHDSPIHSKWDEKTIQAAGDLVGDPLDSRMTSSQFHNDLSTCELNILERWFIMVGSDPQKY